MWPPQRSVTLRGALPLIVAACRFGYETLPLEDRDAGTDGAPDEGADAGLKRDDGAPSVLGDGEAGDASADGDAVYPLCEAGSDCRCATLAGRSYRACLGPLSFASAEAACEAVGMQLARVDDASENAALRQLMTTALPVNLFAFLGATDEATEGSWRWLDGDSEFWTGDAGGSAVAGLYSNWDTNKPFGNKTRNCAGMLVPGAWEDRSCTAQNAFLCEGP